MFLRGRYGHGGRVGYDREWRADPAHSGGGELIDQGVHLIDLSRWFLGPFADVDGAAHTYFWDMPVDDNAFLRLTTPGGQVAFLHVSCTEWKNLFSFEIYGRDGKLHIEGLGGSYGVERLAHYQMLPEMGPPDTTIHEYPRRRSLVGARVRRIPRRYPARARAGGGARAAARGARGRRNRVSRSGNHAVATARGLLMIITRSPASHHARRRRHRPAVLLSRARRISIAAAIDKYVYVTVTRPFTPGIYLEVLDSSNTSTAPTTCGIRSFVKRSRCSGSRRRKWRSRRWPTFRPARVSDPREASPRRCCKALYAHERRAASAARAGGARLRTSRSIDWESRSGSRISISRRSAA